MKQGSVSISILLLLAASCYLQFSAGISWDKAWLELAAKMVLQGKRLYVDIVEPNPPLIIWLYTLPVWLSQHLPVSDAHALVLVGLLTGALCAWLSCRLLALHPGLSGERLANAALLVTFALIARVNVVFFADRDHLFVVLVFPYVLRWLPALRKIALPFRLRAAVGLAAAIGFCIKPHCLVVFVVLQAVYLWKERSARILISIENLIIYGFAAGYLALVWLLTPEYITFFLPMARDTYFYATERLMGILTNVPVQLLLLGVAVAEFRPSRRSALREGSIYCLWMCVAFLLYGLANNGWGYTYLPLETMVLFTCGWLCWDYDLAGLMAGKRACLTSIALSITLTAIGVSGAFFGGPSGPPCEQSASCMRDRAFVGQLGDSHARSFGIFALNFLPWPYYQQRSGAEWDLRLNCFWMLISFMKQDPAFNRPHEWITAYAAKATAEDLNARRPQLVFNDTSPVFKVNGNYVYIDTLLGAYPEFRAAWQHYRLITTFDYCDLIRSGTKASCRFDVFERKD